MATITYRPIIQEMLDNDGRYEDDPIPLAIYEYLGMGGEICWSVIYQPTDLHSLLTSPYVRDPQEIWNRYRGKIRNPTDKSAA